VAKAFDYARYDASAEGVNIDLAKGTATGGDATGDKLTNIEGLVGITEERRSHR
jgi:hypothetical protein